MNSTTTPISSPRSTFDPSRYYPIIVPLLMSGTFLALLGNVYLLMCIRWIRKPAMTANLRLSLSLAGSDAWAAILLLNGWAINNIIPHMLKIQFGEWIRCYYLVLELFRLSGLITSAIHLLALALNHFFSIISPLKYRSTVTPLFSSISIAVLWLFPILVMFVLASTYDGDGFRAPMCGVMFYFRLTFRLIVFLQFAAPLLVMLLIYSYILIRLSAARRRCQRGNSGDRDRLINNNNNSGSSSATSKANGSINKHDRRSSDHQAAKNRLYKKPSISSSSFVQVRSSRRRASTDSRLSTNFTLNRLSAVKNKIKAVTTTLLILGTFVVGWLPAVFMFLLVCSDCSIRLTPTNTAYVFVGNTMVNTLIVSKLLLNPFIYAYRLAEIRYALWVMHATRLGRRPLDINRLPSKFRRMAPSISANPRNTLTESPYILRRSPQSIRAIDRSLMRKNIAFKLMDEREMDENEKVAKAVAAIKEATKICQDFSKDELTLKNNNHIPKTERSPQSRTKVAKRYSWHGYAKLRLGDRRISVLNGAGLSH